jgi:hypothetical protein
VSRRRLFYRSFYPFSSPRRVEMGDLPHRQ